ncbi:ABC transporter permease [Candidatus Leptofilum sp.]|uniref:ABC transporter permease n=1 Tax=Candidatus Leptofilum sp. TaxID=3241576 RepID=UPI003B5BD2B0
MTSQVAATAAVSTSGGLKSRMAGKWPLYLMTIPGLIVVFIFNVAPMYGISIAFKDFFPSRGIADSPWVGLQHFTYLFSLPDTWQVLKNTLIIAILKMVLGFPVPIIVAILINEIRVTWYKKTVQTLIYLPHFISWVILAGILKNMLTTDGGMINNLIVMFGGDPIFFLGSNDWFRTILIASDIWKNFGFSTILYLAALLSIDPQLYESAKIDGASWLQATRYVTLPGITPIMLLTAILSIGSILNANFDQVLNLYNPQVYATGDIIDTFVYRISLVDFNWELGTAVGFFRSIVSMILLIVSYGLAYKYTDYRIF